MVPPFVRRGSVPVRGRCVTTIWGEGLRMRINEGFLVNLKQHLERPGA
jgi:hypothetical protein